MKLVDVFERIGLVEISEDERAAKDRQSRKPAVEEASSEVLTEEAILASGADASSEIDSAAAQGSEAIVENRPLDEIYATAGIAESPFSADKLLKLLDALGSLPEDTRKRAVLAMDAAEDSWTIEDPLLDAQRRIRALELEKKRVGDQADNTEAQAAKALEAQSQYEQQAVAQIRKQIADLEALMEREVKSVAESRERIKGQSKATREACLREQERLDTEIGRLQRIEKMFTVDASETTFHNDHQSGIKNG